MKTLLCTLLILGSFSGMVQAKPGGWIKDILKNNHNCSSHHYYNPSPVYYQEYLRHVIVPQPWNDRPVYYYPVPQPMVVPMRPYQQHYHYYR